MMCNTWYLQYMSSPSFSFCPGPGKSQKLAVMFEDWCGSEECWEKSELVIQMRQVNKVGRRGSRKWMCRHEIVDKYQSESIADEIISQKMAMDETARAAVVRDHPDTPMEELRQYLVFDAESEYDQSDTILESLFSVSDGGGNGRGKKSKKRGRSSSSSTTSTTDTSESSDSDSDDKKKKKSKKSKKSKTSKKNKKGKKDGKKAKKTKAQKEKDKQKQAEKDKKEQEREVEKKDQKVRQDSKKAHGLDDTDLWRAYTFQYGLNGYISPKMIDIKYRMHLYKTIIS